MIAANPSGVLDVYLHDAAGPYSSAGGYFSYEKLPSDLRANFTNRTAEALQWFPSDWPEVNELGFGFPDGKGGTIGVMSAALMATLSRGNVTITSSSSKSGGGAVHLILCGQIISLALLYCVTHFLPLLDPKYCRVSLSLVLEAF